SQNRKLELPVKTMQPGLGGCALSCSSKSRIAGSHPCANTLGTKARTPMPSSIVQIPAPIKYLRVIGLTPLPRPKPIPHRPDHATAWDARYFVSMVSPDGLVRAS